jgi:hypothetical protein
VADWRPVDQLEPAEWFLRPSRTEKPVAVIRRISQRAANQLTEEVWFRVVTWSSASEERELIGWCRTLETAASAGWDYHLALGSWNHHVLAMPRNGPPPQRPPAAEMLRYYRQTPVARERKPQR